MPREPSPEALEAAQAALGEASHHWLTRNFGRVYLDRVVAEALDAFRKSALDEAARQIRTAFSPKKNAVSETEHRIAKECADLVSAIGS